jgi:hypothetical protein
MLIAVAALVALAAPGRLAAQEQAQQLISFDAPNAGASQYQGTVARGINLEGTITGYVTDSSYGTHGFVGTLKGGFTDFDAPGADPIVGCTCAYAINDFGVITGVSVDSNNISHGFVRTPDGTITVFDAPGAYMAAGSGTFVISANSINNLGAVVGVYYDANFTAHGFLRAADGKMTTFDDPAAGNGARQGTWSYGMNDFGVIVGATTYPDGTSHGLLRTPNGRYPDFEFPSATFYNTAYINDFGVIAGSFSQVYSSSEPYDFTGYERTPDGKLKTFKPSGSGTTTTYPYDGTWTNAENIFGATTGYFYNDEAESYAFLREADGKITVFGYPGQAAVPGSYYGSGGYAINAAGVVAGFWNDSNLAAHGLIRLPN